MEEFTGGEYPEAPPVPQVIGDEVPPGRLPNENTANTSSLEWREVSGTSDPVVSSERYQVTFAPQLRGTLASARSPRLDQAYRDASEVFVPISSTNTSRFTSRPPATRTRQAALSDSSLSLAPIDLFFCSNPCV